jgi:tyrosinase
MLVQNLPSIQQRLINLFSRYGNYTEFSNSAWIPDASNASYDSLESLHDNIHSIAGGNSGHMAFIPFSAFDPVFFLHHVNVDRLFAMWQALNPDSWVTPYPALMNSYTTSVGQIQDVNTSLTPFYASSDGTFYNSDMVRNEKRLGYSYAEVANITLGEPVNKTLQSQVVRGINQLYGSSSVYRLVTELREEEDPGTSTKPLAASLVTDGRYREWVANIRVGKQALGGPFIIYLFLGDVPDDGATWSHTANLVGTLNVFAAPDMPGMSMMNPNISGTVPLTTALANKVLSGALLNLETDEVEPYLRQNLKASVVTAQGTVMNLAAIPSLGIHVISSSVIAPDSDDELPVWDSTVTSHFDLV